MIFISHNYKDKPLVETIALKLSNIYGQDNVFYDSWSMQPGEGIIDRMNEGLKEMKFFFFFVSKNSLQSEMVKLEWQNALYKATQNKITLIPVKIDSCLMPDILLQSIYIDIHGKGLENGLRQIIDVINGQNTFTPQFQTYENIRAYISYENPEKEIDIEIRAESYIEPISKYIILVNNTKNNVIANVIGELLNPTGENFMPDIQVNEDIKCNGIYFYIARSTTPDFPIRIKLKSTSDEPIQFIGIYRAVAENKVRLIPIINEVSE